MSEGALHYFVGGPNDIQMHRVAHGATIWNLAAKEGFQSTTFRKTAYRYGDGSNLPVHIFVASHLTNGIALKIAQKHNLI